MRPPLHIILISVFLLLYAALLHGDLKKDADALTEKAEEHMNRAEMKQPGPRRDEHYQKARVLLEKAAALYSAYMKDHTAEGSLLSTKLTEINAKILWCNKFTSDRFDISALPSAEKIMGRDLAEGSGIVQSLSALTPEYIRNLSDDGRARNEKNVVTFLQMLSAYAKRRMLTQAKLLCMNRLKDPHCGIPVRLIKQVLRELEHIEDFIQDVYGRAMEMNGTKLTDASTVTDRTLKGTVSRFDRGILYVNINTDERDTALSAGIPLVHMDNRFLVNNVKTRSKKVMAGIASLYLLEWNTMGSETVVRRMADTEGNPDDLGPLLLRVQAVRAIQHKRQARRDKEDTLRFILSKTGLAVSCFKQERYDTTLSYICRIFRRSGEKAEFLSASSEKCKSLCNLTLPEFTKKAIESCSVCKGTRKMPCPTCNGKGVIRWLLEDERTCPTCKGEKTVECTHCKHRLESEKYKKMLAGITEILKPDEEETGREPDSDVDR